ncbi:MAG: hypothetical protein BroJett003_06280 [Planctomycetota bacterium]|nr:MAG: hypothetical protein BroJett003_06280 [Planctomycetota bacterium]
MNGWQDDKRWSDRFIPQIRELVARHLILEAPLEEDQQHNTDLIVLRSSAVRIACRVRRAQYAKRYGDEFTIRTRRLYGSKTELAKILEGWGDALFYGFGDDAGIRRWLLGDLNVFRSWYSAELRRLPEGCPPGLEQTNGDHSSQFMGFPVHWLPPEFVIARS